MTGADIIVGGVLPNGTPYFSDRFASANELPKLDSHEDWSLLSASENETFTYLKFSRLINTCDEKEDYSISKGTNRIIWALGKTDNLEKHSFENRGTRSVNLLSESHKPQDDGLKEWIAEFSFELNGQETTYWLSLHEAFPLDTDKFVVAYDAYLPHKHAIEHTHHMSLYDCALPIDGSLDETIRNLTVSNGNKGRDAIENEESINSLELKYCKQQSLFTWAAGGKMVVFPDDVAYKFPKSKTNQKKFFGLEVHYHNPGGHVGRKVTNGIKLIYTENPRKYNAGYFRTEYKWGAIVIPPNQTDFVSSGHCSSTCTKDKISPEGISVFSVMLHAHTSTKKIRLRHFRDGQELPWIAFDDHYDFYYQQFRQLDEARKIYPGDHLVVECSHDTTGSNGKAVLGGPSSQNEMCEAFIWYYPKQNHFVYCASHYSITKAFLELGFTKFHYSEEPNLPIVVLDDYIDHVQNKINWTSEFINQLQDLRRYGDHFDQCSEAHHSKLQYDKVVKYPEIMQEYLPYDVCTK